MAIRHQIIDTDTVEYLAVAYYGDQTRWRDIVDYNSLIYPYLSPDEGDRLLPYATGYVHVTRGTSSQPLTIGAGWTLTTKRNIMSTTTKTYYVVNDVTMGIGVTDAYVYVRSVVPGTQGNIPKNYLTELGPEFISHSATNITVTNDDPITNGVEGFVRTTGEYLYIPMDDDVAAMKDNGSVFSYSEMDYFYGSDLRMDDSNDLMIDETAGDLQVIQSTDNVVQAVNRRFSSEKGDILSDFSFGNGIIDIIGDNRIPPSAKEKLIELEIIQALNDEDRISDPVVNSVTIDALNRCCYVDLTLTIVRLGDTITFNNMKLGGMS